MIRLEIELPHWETLHFTGVLTRTTIWYVYSANCLLITSALNIEQFDDCSHLRLEKEYTN